MLPTQLPIPDTLIDLIDTGVWPTNSEGFSQQELKPILGRDAAVKLSAGDRRIVLLPPPFLTIAKDAEKNQVFWSEELNFINEIDFKRSLIFADFGLGSDSVIVMNYERGTDPRVFYLKWLDTLPPRHEWVCTHETFDLFCADVGLLENDAN